MLPSRVDNCSFLNLYFQNVRMSLAVCLQEGEARALWWRV